MQGKKNHHREHVDEYILENPEKFRFLVVKAINNKLFKDLRLTIDTKDDFKFIEKIIRLLEKNNLEINVQNICLLKEKGYLK